MERIIMVWGLGLMVACSGASSGEPRTGVTRSPLTSATQLYLHQSGSAAILDATAPIGTAPALADSATVSFNGGNPWVDVGTWSATPSVANGALTAAYGRLWLGLESHADREAHFDLRVEVMKNGAAVAATEQLCIGGLSEDPSLAKTLTLPLGAFEPVPFDGSADVLSMKITTRVGTDGSGALCGGHRRHTHGLRMYVDAIDRASALAITFTSDVAERWVAVSCRLFAPSASAISTYVDSDGNFYRYPTYSFGPPPRAGSLAGGQMVPPTSKLSAQDLLALLIALQTLDTSTAGYTTVTGPVQHQQTFDGMLESAGAPGSATPVDRWMDGVAAGSRTLTTSNDPAAAVVRKYTCFNPN